MAFLELGQLLFDRADGLGVNHQCTVNVPRSADRQKQKEILWGLAWKSAGKRGSG